MTILLRDFASKFGQYELDLLTGGAQFRQFATFAEGQRGTRGFGVTKMVGLFPREQAFFALYTLDQRLLLYAGGEIFDLSNGTSQVKRYGRTPFTRCFSISSDNRVRHVWRYWYTDMLEDRFNIRDFFLYVTQTARSEKEMATFIYFWEGVSQGRNPTDPSFQSELEGFLKQKFDQEIGTTDWISNERRS